MLFLFALIGLIILNSSASAASATACVSGVSKPVVHGWHGEIGDNAFLQLTHRLRDGILAGWLWQNGTRSEWVSVDERQWRCSPDLSTYPVSIPQDPADKYLGTMRWVSPGEPRRLCDSPTDMLACFTRIESGAFIVTDRVDRVTNYGGKLTLAYKIQLADGRIGYIDSSSIISTDDAKYRQTRLAAEAECKRLGGISVGMTKDQVYATCWGRPQKINTTVTGSGTREQMVYSSGAYVYLENGVVTAIQSSQSSR